MRDITTCGAMDFTGDTFRWNPSFTYRFPKGVSIREESPWSSDAWSAIPERAVFSYSKRTGKFTTVAWFPDGDKVRVTTGDGETFSARQGILECVWKKLTGSGSAAKRRIRELTEDNKSLETALVLERRAYYERKNQPDV